MPGGLLRRFATREHRVAGLLLEHGAKLVVVVDVHDVHGIGEGESRLPRMIAKFSSFAYEALKPRLWLPAMTTQSFFESGSITTILSWMMA